MRKWRKRPVIVEAEQWIPGENDALIESIGMINHGDRETIVHIGTGRYHVPAGFGLIPTLEGPHLVTPRDWIIVGVEGEVYPCKDSIFKATYEPLQHEQELSA